MGERREKEKKKITYNWNVVYYKIWISNFRGKSQIINQIIIYNYLCKWAKVETPINNSSNLIIFWNQMNSNVHKCYEIEEHEQVLQFWNEWNKGMFF